MQATDITRSKFRTDINGLRAVAVIAVILYHFGVAGFDGGFLGVDVFFVISGFLMTGIVVKGLERGTFSFFGFYMARARRIVPALVVLCLAMLCMGWFVLMPPDYKLLGTHAISALGFFSNFKFWDESGYFDLSSHEKWLLHTWSLSVEWQFYLILPLALWAVWRFKPGRSTQTRFVLISLILSFGMSILTTASWPSAAFFLLPTRAWEMLAGGVVFLYAKPTNLSSSLRRWLDITGALLILMAMFGFDTNSQWPGWRASIPVLGTVLVLVASRTSFWTGNRVAQWVGDRSYSLYLWHWPVFVALVYAQVQRETIAIFGGMILTLALGHFSYLLVENPARRLLSKPSVFKGTFAFVGAVATTSVLAFGVRQLDGFHGRFSMVVEAAAAEAGNFNPRNKDCHLSSGHISPSCVFGGNVWKIIGLGDSHLTAVISALAAAQSHGDAGVVEWSYSGCPYVPGMKFTPQKLARVGKGYRCNEFIDWEQAQLHVQPADIPVVIVGRYAQLAFGSNEENSSSNVPEIFFSRIYSNATPEFLREFAQHIADSACDLAKRRTVFMMRPIPEMGFDVPRTLSRRIAAGLMGDVSISIDDYRKRNQWVWDAQDAAHDRCGVKILDPLPYLCDSGKCYGSKNLHALYFDDDHLSEFGNKLLIPMFAAVFDPLIHSKK